MTTNEIENPTEACALVTATLRGTRYVLLIEREDGTGWAMPGGAIEPGQGGLQVATRKLEWQTALDPRLPVWKTVIWTEDEPRWVPDPRGAVTVVARCDLGEVDALPEVRPGGLGPINCMVCKPGHEVHDSHGHGGSAARRVGWWGTSETRWAAEYTDVILPAHREILGALR